MSENLYWLKAVNPVEIVKITQDIEKVFINPKHIYKGLNKVIGAAHRQAHQDHLRNINRIFQLRVKLEAEENFESS